MKKGANGQTATSCLTCQQISHPIWNYAVISAERKEKTSNKLSETKEK